jgi:acyl-CoA synthetase (AMP-forming)/AMP-acid ligase II
LRACTWETKALQPEGNHSLDSTLSVMADARLAWTRTWYERGYYGGDTFGRAMARGVESNPDGRIYFWYRDQLSTLTLGEIDERGRQVAGALYARGLRAGDVTVLQIPNSPEYAVMWYAGCLLGLILVPVVTIYGATELGQIVRDSRAKALVVPDRWGKIDFLRRLADIGPSEHLEHVVVIGTGAPAGAIGWADLTEGDAAPFPPEDRAADDISVLLYTSGTTAEPKGVAHSHNSLLAELRLTDQFVRHADEVFFNPSPSGHVTGILQITRPMVLGSRQTVFMDRWDAETAVALINEFGATCAGTTPFFLSTALDVADRDGAAIRTMRKWMVGGAGVPPSLVERADAVGIRTWRAFGSTEHPTITTGRPDDELSERAMTDGTAVPGTIVRIVDEEGVLLGPGREGEVEAAGPDQMLCYLDPANQTESFSSDGFFRTGDVGVLDAGGYLRITDRKKDIIIRGGENLSSREIENVLSRHPAVAEAAAVSMPDLRYGEKVCAFVVLRDRGSLTLEEVVHHFDHAGVARQKTPEQLEIVTDLPRTPSGKIRKADLRARLQAEGTSRLTGIRPRPVARDEEQKCGSEPH